MGTPRNLSEAFEASNENDASQRNQRPPQSETSKNPLVAKGTSTPGKRPQSQSQSQSQSPHKTVEGHQSPIGKHLPKPMRMAEIITTSKRVGYLGWDDYFLGIAVLSSQRSKDPTAAEGACIADASNRIVAIGYSGLPRGCPDTVFPWKEFAPDTTTGKDVELELETETETEEHETADSWLHSKRPYICDAATNAVLNKGSQDLTGCRLYVTSFPTSDCVKVMIQSGIKELIILQKDTVVPDYGQAAVGNCSVEDEEDHALLNQLQLSSTATEDELAGGVMLSLADIRVRYYRPPISSVVLEFDSDERQVPPPFSLPKTCVKIPTDEEARAAIILKEETGYDALDTTSSNGRRQKYLSWDDYFMSVALLTAKRSKDPNTIVGACIVDDQNRIVGLGYNGMPRGLSDDTMPWAKHNANPLFNKYKYVTHAEVNAILNSKASYSSHVNGGTIYVSLFPCENCTKMIIQSGIKKVVYLKDTYHETDGCRASRVMMRCAKIEVEQYHPTAPQVDVTFYNEREGESGRTA